MSLYRELAKVLPYDPAEGAGLYGYRGAESAAALRVSAGAGGATALILLTGVGLVPPGDWGAALFWGLVAAVFTRGACLVWQWHARGGWHAWRGREPNTAAIDGVSAGMGVLMATILLTGAGGIGPTWLPAEALFGGLVVGIASRALLTVARWP